MTKTSRMVGCLLIATLMAGAQTANAASDALPATPPSQMLDLANKALAAGQLSAQDHARILVRRGLAREMLGQRSEALDDFSAAIASSALGADEQATALYDRGVTLDELNRTDDAIADYSAALELAPMLAAALNNRGNALRRLGRLAEAERDYEASMAAGNLHPEYPEYGMGQIAETLGQPSAALEYYRSALATNPQFTLAAERLAAMDTGAPSTASSAPIVLTKPGRAVPPAASHPPPAVIAGAAPVLKPAISETAATEKRSIQLGAWRTKAEANGAWVHLQKSTGDLLASVAPLIVPVDLQGKGRWYRLRIGQLDPAGASRLCGSLRAKGIACIEPPD